MKRMFVVLALLSRFAAAEVVQVTEGNYKEMVQEASLPMVVDINATWCGPCQMMNPIIEDLSGEYQGRVQFAKIDFDSQQKLAEKYGVNSLPTLLFLKPGKKKPVMKNEGFISKEALRAKINELLGPSAK